MLKPIVFIAGGVPGITPYASGPHIWGRGAELFREKNLVRLEGATLEEMQTNLLSRVGEKCHVVAHDVAGLVALLAAAEQPKHFASVTVVASVAAAPTGDGVPNYTLAHPPEPRFSRESQRWALERVSYSHHHIDDALLDACVAARVAPGTKFPASLMAAKGRFYALCRDQGYPVPVQVVWGSHDPLATLDHGLWLFRILAARQRVAQFNVINRAGSLVFRDEPEAFHQVVSAFVEANS